MNPPTITNLPFPDLDLLFVEGGQFLMGDEVGDLWEACRPVHPVKVSSFYMAKFPVTQRLWQAVMGSNPAYFKGDLRPVETVSWLDAQEFIKKLNALYGHPPLGGRGLGLPTEAEWEYAARGGIYSQGYTYAGSDKLKQVGWYNENANDETHEVGLLLANELGIHDLSGNVYEWCEDWFDEKIYEKHKKKGLVENPLNKTGVNRVVRGGSCFDIAVLCRPADRYGLTPGDRINFIGFRLCLPLQFSP